MSVIRRMDHFTVVTDRLEETRDFYSKLGLKVGPRPDFPVAGIWFYAADQAVLHVVAVDELPDEPRGVIDHIAFYGEGLADTLALLDAEKIAYRVIRTPRPFSTWQVFFNDPNGAEVEIDFDASEPAPPHMRRSAVPGRP